MFCGFCLIFNSKRKQWYGAVGIKLSIDPMLAQRHMALWWSTCVLTEYVLWNTGDWQWVHGCRKANLSYDHYNNYTSKLFQPLLGQEIVYTAIDEEAMICLCGDIWTYTILHQWIPDRLLTVNGMGYSVLWPRPTTLLEWRWWSQRTVLIAITILHIKLQDSIQDECYLQFIRLGSETRATISNCVSPFSYLKNRCLYNCAHYYLSGYP